MLAPTGTETCHQGTVEIGRFTDAKPLATPPVPRDRVETNDPTVSPRHCRIDVDRGTLRVEDLHSDNGTWLLMNDGTWTRLPPGRPTEIPSGSTLLLGRVQIEAYGPD